MRQRVRLRSRANDRGRSARASARRTTRSILPRSSFAIAKPPASARSPTRHLHRGQSRPLLFLPRRARKDRPHARLSRLGRIDACGLVACVRLKGFAPSSRVRAGGSHFDARALFRFTRLLLVFVAFLAAGFGVPARCAAQLAGTADRESARNAPGQGRPSVTVDPIALQRRPRACSRHGGARLFRPHQSRRQRPQLSRAPGRLSAAVALRSSPTGNNIESIAAGYDIGARHLESLDGFRGRTSGTCSRRAAFTRSRRRSASATTTTQGVSMGTIGWC